MCIRLCACVVVVMSAAVDRGLLLLVCMFGTICEMLCCVLFALCVVVLCVRGGV